MQIPGFNTIKQVAASSQRNEVKKVAATVIVGETAVLYGADKFIKSKNNG